MPELNQIQIIMNLLPLPTYKTEDDIRDFKLDQDFGTSGLNFVAIDLETATWYRNSICEIGIAIVENGEVKESKSWLVRPPRNEYFSFNVMIHGIHPEDTEESPSFKEVWDEVNPYLEGKVVVAHNTAFDMYVLRDSFIENEMPFPSFAHFCSCRYSKRVIECYSYSLDSVCEKLEIEMGNHHRAGEDAEACAKVFIECIKKDGVNSFTELLEKYRQTCGRFSDKYFRPQRSIRDYSNKKGIDLGAIQGDPDKIDEGSYFYGKAVCFTGKCQYGIRKDLLQMIADIGGIPMDSVTAKTDILIVGQQDYRVVGDSGMSSKQKKAIALKDKGQDIEIMSEAEFLSNLSI